MTGPVVLAGGGEVGIAWETGLAAGLLDEGVDLRTASLIVGTSAGSVVGSRLAAGVDPREIADRLIARGEDPDREPNELVPGGEDSQVLKSAFAKLLEQWATGGVGGSMAEVGRFALEASPIPEAAFVGGLERRLRIGDEFPDRLAVTAVDTATGEFKVFDSQSGAPLAAVVAASCSVPGLFPPVTIGEHRFMDGGARSVTNADVALRAEPAPALVVTMLGGRAPAGSIFESWERRLAREASGLEEAGFPTYILRAGPEETMAMGPNPMDSNRAPDAVRVGRERGRAEASKPELDAWRI
jgi:NTE family protein